MICFRNYHFIALGVLLFFSVASWGSCTTSTNNYNTSGSNPIPCICGRTIHGACPNPNQANTCEVEDGKINFGCGYLAGSVGSRVCPYNYSLWSPGANCIATGIVPASGSGTRNSITIQCCTTQEELDELFCSLYPTASSCAPDTSLCDLARARCNKLGGVFTGTPLQDGCSSSCNTCGTEASKQILKVKSESCCSQGLAPSIEQMCQTPIQSGVGETYSTNANLECSDPSLSEEGASAYAEYCSGDYDWDENSSSSGGEGDFSSSSGEGLSSEEGTSAGASEGLEGDYYPILDTIRDTLVNIRRNVENIYTCLITPSACAGLSSPVVSGDTTIVNIPSDSAKLNDISSKLTILDTSIHNSNERLLEGISRGNDTLIDSMRKYLNSLGFSGDTIGDSLGRIHGTLEEIKGALDGEEVDTTGYGSWGDLIGEGTSIGDSIGVASGWVGGLDSVNIDSVFSAAVADSLNADSIGEHIDSILKKRLDSLHNELKLSIDSNRSSLVDSLNVWADTISALAPWADFDSLIYSTIGAKIPNSDQCPENCQKWAINLPGFGLVNYSVDFGLCLGRSVLGNLSVLSFIRLLVRLVVVWTCIWFVIWNFTKKKD